MPLKENSYIHHYSKDLIQWLPLAAFGGEVIVVDTPEKVEEAVAYLSKQPAVGVDTESRPSFTRGVHYPTALLQIATEERCYLFRLTHVGMPQALADLFANPKITKVGLAFKDDIAGLRRRRDFKPANCIDLQTIVPKYGILDLGLQEERFPKPNNSPTGRTPTSRPTKPAMPPPTLGLRCSSTKTSCRPNPCQRHKWMPSVKPTERRK